MPLLQGCHKGLAVLVDPDKIGENTQVLLGQMEQCPPSMVLLGGSTSVSVPDSLVDRLHAMVSCPVVLFPGNASQFSPKADALFFLSLISGRNPEWLIGQQVKAAQVVKASGIEVVPVGYMLVESGGCTAVQRVSQTQPIARDAVDIAVSTALAGELLGMQAIYLEAGSGARLSVPTVMVRAVKQALDIPLIVGGGLRSRKEVEQVWEAGADLVVVGNALETNPQLYRELLR